MKEQIEKMDGKDMEILLSHRCAISSKEGIVLMQLTLDGYANPLNIALPPEQAKSVLESLQTALSRLQSIQ